MGKWKFNPGDIVMANEKAPGDYRGRQATIVEHGPGTAEILLWQIASLRLREFEWEVIY